LVIWQPKLGLREFEPAEAKDAVDEADERADRNASASVPQGN
jgi:hypothetical protein